MSQKNKRKGTPTRPIWQVLAVVLVMGAIALAVWWYYTDIPATNDGADIIFMREEGNRVSNIYTLDIDDPEAEAIPLTDYTPDSIERIDSMGYPDGGSWVAYIENHANSNSIKKIDLASREITTILDCNSEQFGDCQHLQVSPNGRYAAFISYRLEVGWVIDLEDPSAEPILIDHASPRPVFFLDDETLIYWAYIYFAVVIQDIATGEMTITNIKEDVQFFSPDASRITYNYGTVFNQNGDIIKQVGTPFSGDLSSWHPDNIQYLVTKHNPDLLSSGIALINSDTGDGRILVEQSGYIMIDTEWKADGRQFLFWRRALEEEGYEGEIWVYDMESGEARPLNQVGASVGWLD